MEVQQILPAATEETEKEPEVPRSMSEQEPVPSTSQEQGDFKEQEDEAGNNDDDGGEEEEESWSSSSSEEEEEEEMVVVENKEEDRECCNYRKEEEGEGGHNEKEAIISNDDVDKVRVIAAPPSNRVKKLCEGHQILNVTFGISFALLAVLRWYEGRAEFGSGTTLIGLVVFIVHMLVWALPQPMISRNYAGLENYMRTAAVVLDVYVALLMVNIQYIIIVIIPLMIFLFIGALAWKSRETGVSQYKNNEEILSAKNLSSKSSVDLVLCEVTNYLLLLSLVAWTQYKGEQGCTPILSDFLLFLGSALGAVGAMLASPLAGFDYRAVSIQVLPVLHKTCAVLLLVAVHTLAAEWLGEDMVFVCLPELIALLVWFTIYFGQVMSVSSFESLESKVIAIGSVVGMLVCLTSWYANDRNMRLSWVIWVFWISLSSSALSIFHASLLVCWPGRTSHSNKLIHLLKVAAVVSFSTSALLCACVMLTDPGIFLEPVSSFQHEIIAAVPIIFLLTFVLGYACCCPRRPETHQKEEIPVTAGKEHPETQNRRAPHMAGKEHPETQNRRAPHMAGQEHPETQTNRAPVTVGMEHPETQTNRAPVTERRRYYVKGELTHMLVNKLYPKLDELLKATLPSEVCEDVTVVQSRLQNMHGMITTFECYSYSPTKAWIRMVHELACDIENWVELYGNHVQTKIQDLRKRLHDAMEQGNHLLYTDNFNSAANPVGLERPRDNVVKMVAPARSNSDELKHLEVVSIVGMLGSGKSALASQVYHSERIVRKFKWRSWVQPEDQDMASTLAYMLSKLVGDGDCTLLYDPSVNFDQIAMRLKRFLQKKRYLVILDGLEHLQTWLMIKDCFPENNLGSRIIITTRSYNLAVRCGTAHDRLYRHSLLDGVDAETLFHQTAFGTAGGVCPDGLKVVSDQILKKCRGLPLAILSVGDVLASKRSTADELKKPGLPWQELQSMQELIEDSYHHLDSKLKICLWYLSIFPVEQVVEVERLVRLWIAEEFSNGQHHPTTNQEKVITANYFIRELVSKNFIMYADGLERTISIHPVIHSFILYKSMEENFVTLLHSQQEDFSPTENVSPSNGTARRLSLLNNGKEDQTAGRSYGKKLRSVTVFNNTSGMPMLDGMSGLRVLDLEGCEGPVCLDGLCQLLLLRYLGLRGTHVSELPAQIEKLTCLETLDVRSTKVKEIPRSIIRLQKMMHLLVGNAKLPRGIGEMKTLRALSCSDVITDSTSTIWEVSDMYNLTDLELICESRWKQVVFPSHGFRSLHNLSIQFGLSSLTFETGALPNVQFLGLNLDNRLAEGTTSVAGIEHLTSLKNVHIKHFRDDANAKAAVAALEVATSHRPKKPLFSVEEYSGSVEECSSCATM